MVSPAGLSLAVVVGVADVERVGEPFGILPDNVRTGDEHTVVQSTRQSYYPLECRYVIAYLSRLQSSESALILRKAIFKSHSLFLRTVSTILLFIDTGDSGRMSSSDFL